MRQDDIFHCQGINISNAGESKDDLLKGLISRGFDDTQICSKCFPASDRNRNSPMRENFLAKIRRLRQELDD
jgi:hypothetical protein